MIRLIIKKERIMNDSIVGIIQIIGKDNHYEEHKQFYEKYRYLDENHSLMMICFSGSKTTIEDNRKILRYRTSTGKPYSFNIPDCLNKKFKELF